MTTTEADSTLLLPLLLELNSSLESYLLDSESLPIHDSRNSMRIYSHLPEPLRLFNIMPSPLATCLEVERDAATGHISGVLETLKNDIGCTSKNSFSLRRFPDLLDKTVKGSTTNYPFWPGGLSEYNLLKELGEDSITFDPECYLEKHPKLSSGLKFDSVEGDKDEIDIVDMMRVDENIFSLFDSKTKSSENTVEVALESTNYEAMLTDILDKSISVTKQHIIQISTECPNDEFIIKKAGWAKVVNVNCPVADFSVKVPTLACNFPFELDTFQKQAILCLEKHECVFVAAHTSAGKTVIAEYAIALALKHMTKAIYTSPIKALSNQKYRELKLKFGDVGLLTGDIQINSKASCLIMTTEILQSMLYNGSDTIRDLEWVIFDEVHYINNDERGHVWEEVIIMLPAHVNIVLLSATVPNTIEFADWIGQIKKKNIYVISTRKRPVPLEHYLYTCTTKNEKFLIVDASGRFLEGGYKDALAVKTEKEKKSHPHQSYKGGQHFMSEHYEKNMWIGLIDHLRKKELLPVVAFTLSKKRCNQNAMRLISQDLTTKQEKGEIHTFVKRCIDRLKGSDKELPQVAHVTELLKKGIGVHHSGILPILKEVVEMLFAKGLVKFLFATETFAMGVNMPARCVVFDSIRKYDGNKPRDFLPSEYIQMAGRAGRRGLDSIGTVIILCKGDLPDMMDLRNMMLGRATKLESKFQLTYKMILNLLRVEVLRVEDMMRRSFSESFLMQNLSEYRDALQKKEEELSTVAVTTCMSCSNNLSCYTSMNQYLALRSECLSLIYSYPVTRKMLHPGRIIKISFKNYQNYIACVLKVDLRDNNKFVVLVLEEESFHEETNPTDTAIKTFLATCSKDKFHCIEGKTNHKLLEIHIENIIEISSKIIKIDGDKIIDNVRKREIPRFRDDPLGKSVLEVVTELQRINESSGNDLVFLNFYQDFKIKEINVVTKFLELEKLKTLLMGYECLKCPEFCEHFTKSFRRFTLLEEIGELKYRTSEQALKLHPEYQTKINVLKQLGYIENNNTVTLKGRVACEIGNHELIVTELLLENVFTDKPIEEITALLSSLIFTEKRCSERNSTGNLSKGIKQFKEVARKIGIIQRNCGVFATVDDYVDQFNFGLSDVVYQWTIGIDFNKIMELTDVEEGIVVKCIQRLNETLMDVKNAAKIIGDPNLYENMQMASTAIKRDIVFIASLYTQ